MPEFHAARVLARWEEATELGGLRLQVPAAVQESYRVPGQYVQLRVPAGDAAFLAIASPPGHADLEFLVKQSPATDALLAVSPGDAIELTIAQGPGFPVEAHRGQDVLLFAAGTGISAIRSLIGYLAEHRADYAGVTLFFGARTLAHLPYDGELPAWEAAGIQVVRVLSRLEEPSPGVFSGYVQQALAVHPVQEGRTVAFVCGMAAMVGGVSAELARRGVPAERIFQNF